MKTVKVRNIVIGEGSPKICVPIVGPGRVEVYEQAKEIYNLRPDVVELRIDCFDEIADESMLAEIRDILGDTAILFTIRSSKEGGYFGADDASYADINKKAVRSGLIDMVDIELFKGDAIVRDLIETAHSAGVKTVASNHDFNTTPSKEAIKQRLEQMQDIGADIAKIAVMPKDAEDVATLIDAAKEVCQSAVCPIIAISMGELGAKSRIECKEIGTAMTFASAGRSSAPGQIDIRELREEFQNDNR